MRAVLGVLFFCSVAVYAVPASASVNGDELCQRVKSAGLAGVAAAEAAALATSREVIDLPEADQRGACLALACGAKDASADVADAISRGIASSGNETVSVCFAELSNLKPAAIDEVPPDVSAQ